VKLGASCPTRFSRQGRPRAFAYRTITCCGVAFHPLRLTRDFVTSRPAGRDDIASGAGPNFQQLEQVILEKVTSSGAVFQFYRVSTLAGAGDGVCASQNAKSAATGNEALLQASGGSAAVV
jgi:hypothetical protein